MIMKLFLVLCLFFCPYSDPDYDPGLGSVLGLGFPLQVYEILARTPYGSVKRGEVGIDRLLNEQAFSAAYPLHEVRT